MTFPFNAYLLALVGSFLTTALTLPLWRQWSQRLGLMDQPGERKIHATPVSLVGGLAVATGFLIPILGAQLILTSGLLAPEVAEPVIHGLGRRTFELVAIIVGALGMVILGAIDDRHMLSPGPKFGGQVMIAFLVAASGIRITLFVDNVLFSYAITILWMLTLINAFNFMDNMNGLCGGLGVIGAAGFALSAMARGQYLVALIALLVCGALLGFLPYNFPKASVFLGDSGSHLVGYLMAVLAILPHFYSSASPNPWDVLDPLLILGVPLIDLVCVVIIRWRLGKPFYVGDNNHISHRLVRRGLSKPRAVLVIWLFAALLGFLAAL